MTQRADKIEQIDKPARRGRLVFAAAASALLIAQVAAAFYFVPTSVVFAKAPLGNLDYEIVVNQTSVVTKAMDAQKKLWAYDPGLLAGIPNGVELNNNSRAWQLGTFALWKAGLKKTWALNLFVLAAHLLLPWVMFFSARLFHLSRWTALTAALVGALIWYFDGYVHWGWWSGSAAWVTASYLAILALALLYSFISNPRWWPAALLAAVLPVTIMVHAYAAIALIVPFAAFYLEFLKKLKLEHHLFLLGAVALAVACNFHFAQLAVKFWEPSAGSTGMGQGTLSHLLTDFLGINSDTRVSGGVAMRSGFRFLALGAAAITLVIWFKSRDRRTRPIAISLLALLGLAYLGGYVPGLRSVQPYRNVVPAIFLAIFPAAALIDEVKARGALSNLPKMAKAVGLIILLATIPRLARDVVYFTPAFFVEPRNLPEETPHIADMIGFGSIGYPKHRNYRLKAVPQYLDVVARGIKEWSPKQGRVLVEYEPLAEHLAWRTKAEIIGGSSLRSPVFLASSLFRRYPVNDPPTEELRKYLETYAVGWAIVLSNPVAQEKFYRERLQYKIDLFEVREKIWPFRVLKCKLPVSYFQKGSGKITASMNRIEVRDTEPNEDIVLRYHFIETLACLEKCKVEREPIDGDPMGFIRVRAPHPANFVILNDYE